MLTIPFKRVLAPLLAGMAVVAALVGLPAQAQNTLPSPAQDSTSGPIRLRPAVAADVTPAPPAAPVAAGTPAGPGEFEAFVKLPRFGADMVTDLAAGAADFNPVVPADYVIQVGDEILLTLWGSLDADLRLVVDRAGRVNIPRVGPVLVAGTAYSELQAVLTQRVGAVFKNFQLSASLGRLRGLRVYVTGFVQKPGAYVVPSLATVVNAVMRAGGPAESGSFRRIELRREGKVAATLDLYDLLLRGDRRDDRLVRPDDVIHVLPVGPQVALRGSVNKPSVFELKEGETLRDLLAMAAGFNPVADRSRVALERLTDRNGQRVVQVELPAGESTLLLNGDVVRAFSAVEASLSTKRQNKRVRVEGEVNSPGEYVLPPESTLRDALRAAGGLTSAAYIHAANFSRESVRVAQQQNYERALRDLETDIARASATQRVSTADEAATQTVRTAGTSRLLERLRALQPTGRVVLNLTAESTELPEILLEDGDRLLVPPRPTTVGVFGSVFNGGSYLYSPDRTLGDYLRLAGGPTKGADEGSTFVVRPNGQVVSSRQDSSWFQRGGKLGGQQAQPGDTIFVPEELDKTTFVQAAKDWTLILYQLGIGLAGVKSVVNF